MKIFLLPKAMKVRCLDGCEPYIYPERNYDVVGVTIEGHFVLRQANGGWSPLRFEPIGGFKC